MHHLVYHFRRFLSSFCFYVTLLRNGFGILAFISLHDLQLKKLRKVLAKNYSALFAGCKTIITTYCKQIEMNILKETF